MRTTVLTPVSDSLTAVFDAVEALNAHGVLRAAATSGYSATIGSLFLMSVGNRLGLRFEESVQLSSLFDYAYGSFVLETVPGTSFDCK